ncbi:Triosephosphate isomerase [Anaerohalosphaera lusitana]|uniref:Triosephosphate isomerase n=1 Tax=Anaerohalosphaera lusitana TaxID=1936003 RepID=A0A1U9NHD2_9BACT|nr:triose-phosphate isomerase [Anaerohalosphaera lusitana]AQT67215.1 Triosephosphate isomerase [Anaerohalosphaera lusitana]
MRKPFIAGNWKMNKDSAGSVELAAGLAKELKDVDSVDVAVCPPFVYLQAVSNAVSGSPVKVGAQNMYFEANGAFTGEISTDMLKDVGCTYVICGHSERRHVIGETDELVNKKVKAAIESGLLPILAVGELLEEREADKTNDVVKTQVTKGLEGVSADDILKVTIAYEPVWAIGTGKTATPDQAQDVHAMIRGLIAELYSQDVADKIRIQYGGSAKPANTAELMAQPDVDGLLVGGASLKVEDFSKMIKTVA